MGEPQHSIPRVVKGHGFSIINAHDPLMKNMSLMNCLGFLV